MDLLTQRLGRSRWQFWVCTADSQWKPIDDGQAVEHLRKDHGAKELSVYFPLVAYGWQPGERYLEQHKEPLRYGVISDEQLSELPAFVTMHLMEALTAVC